MSSHDDLSNRSIEIQQALAQSRVNFFAGNPCMSKSERADLELEVIEIRAERLKRKQIRSAANPTVRTTQLAMLAERLAAMGLHHLMEETRREAIAAGAQPETTA
jgi:hypothetical protein